MEKNLEYDLVVIGAGIAGLVSAVTAISLSQRVAIVEKEGLVATAVGTPTFLARLLYMQVTTPDC